MYLIEVQNVRKAYGGKEVLKSISIGIESSEICLIVGPSGAGKTTLLNILASIEVADEGVYMWKGLNKNNVPPKERRRLRRENMSFIFQEFNVFEELTVRENLELFLKYATTIDKVRWVKLISEGVDRFKIRDRINTRAKLLSGGERQRLAILRSFLKDTEVVFADEPTANVDDSNKRLILESFDLLKQKGSAVIIVSHDRSYIDFVDKVYRLDDGVLTCDK